MKPTQSVTNSIMAALGLLSALLPLSRSAHAQVDVGAEFVVPAVFQAAGPNAASIQGTVDAYRAALGDPNNANNPGPLTSGRREINWDGGNPAIMDTTPPVSPFNVFLNTRGAQFTTPGEGLAQATPSGLAELFNNPTYSANFATFSPSRLFTPAGSNITDGTFFVPGSNGITPASVNGFGVVFSDVDAGRSPRAGTKIEYFDRVGKRIFTSFAPASPGDASLSFVGIKFNDARIASVRITTDEALGGDDLRRHDIVVMDDFIYGEPQLLQ